MNPIPHSIIQAMISILALPSTSQGPNQNFESENQGLNSISVLTSSTQPTATPRDLTTENITIITVALVIFAVSTILFSAAFCMIVMFHRQRQKQLLPSVASPNYGIAIYMLYMYNFIHCCQTSGTFIMNCASL